MPRDAKWRTTEQLAMELQLFDPKAIDRLDQALRAHEAECISRLDRGLAAGALIRRAKYPHRTTALPLWGSVKHHGQPWIGHRPERGDAPDDIPGHLRVPPSAPNVFLSYAARDSDVALRLAESLATMGIGCWRFQTHIEVRRDIATCVRNAIVESSGLVGLVTRTSIASLWVLTELHTCLQLKRALTLVVDAQDALLLSLLQSVRFKHPDAPFDLDVEYDKSVLQRLSSDYAVHESLTRAQRYESQARDFLASLPSYLATGVPHSSVPDLKPMVALPHPPEEWASPLRLDSLQRLSTQLYRDGS